MPSVEIWLHRAAVYRSLAGQFEGDKAREAWLKVALQCEQTARDIQQYGSCASGVADDSDLDL